MKKDGRYGVHKIGTVDDFFLQKKFKQAQKRLKKVKFQNKWDCAQLHYIGYSFKSRAN